MNSSDNHKAPQIPTKDSPMDNYNLGCAPSSDKNIHLMIDISLNPYHKFLVVAVILEHGDYISIIVFSVNLQLRSAENHFV